MPIRNRATLLLDLDGTLVDPAAGIIACVRDAMARAGAPVAEDTDLRWIIGPPLRVTVAKLLDGRGDVEAVVAHYRERYSAQGLYDATAYPGMIEVLTARAQAGTRLILCTSKARVFAHRVVEHFGYASLPSAVYGAELDGRFDDKGDLIAHLLAREGLVSEQVCMVGDREHDVAAAARNGVPTVGVLWGYGGRAELEAAGAAAIVSHPRELLGFDDATA